jgi:SAM-dependent methyltransferase
MSLPTHGFVASDPDIYEKFMARWSARLADPFLTFAGIRTGQRVLDVGCGTGTISLALAERGCSVVGIDASKPYLEGARRRRSHAAITYELGDAQNLAHPSGSFDACVSTLAIDVVPEPKKFAAEMRRVTRAGGIVACGTFDFWGGFSAAEHIIEIGATLDEDMRAIRDYRRARPLFWPNGMTRLWEGLGLTDVTEVPIVISFDFESFDDYWTSLCTGPNSMAQRMNVMPSERRDDIHRLVMSSYLASMDDGPRSFASIVRSVRGVVP